MRTHIILTREQYSKAEVCTPDNLGEPTPWYEMVWTLLANCWTNHTKEIARTCQNEARWPCSNLPSKLNSVFKKWCNLVWSDEKETARNHATYCDWWLYNTVYLLELLPVLKRITQSCTRSSYCKSNSFAQRVIVETDWGASTWSVSRNLRIALPKITGASACWLEVLKCGRLGWHALADYKMEHKYGVQNGVPLKKTLEAHKRGVQVLNRANRRLRHLVPLRFHTRITHCTLHLDEFFLATYALCNLYPPI